MARVFRPDRWPTSSLVKPFVEHQRHGPSGRRQSSADDQRQWTHSQQRSPARTQDRRYQYQRSSTDHWRSGERYDSDRYARDDEWSRYDSDRYALDDEWSRYERRHSSHRSRELRYDDYRQY